MRSATHWVEGDINEIGTHTTGFGAHAYWKAHIHNEKNGA